jgi:acyl-coenzyme A synthetase/AMP-(fatty) acid ligase
MALVRARRSPITGAIVVADVVAKRAGDKALENELLETCRRVLPPHKVPAAIRFVASLDVTATGKLSRHGP